MAKIYVHKLHGLQLRFTIYFPEGKVVRYRFSRSRDEMYSLHRAAEMLEVASRRCDASLREVEVAVNLGLITNEEASLLTGGKRSSSYVLDLVMERWAVSSSLANSPYSHEVNLRRAKRLRLWLESNPIPTLDPARYGMSPGYLVQVETYADEFVKNVSGEKLWALGCLYRVDPLALFCLSRGMTSLLDSKTRNSLFGKFSL
jgi:hypothetical protein